MKTKSTENFLDKLVMFFSPRAGTDRLKFKIAATHLRSMGAYDAAKKGRRLKNWRAPDSSINTETEFSLRTLRNRSRDLVRNNTYAAKYVDLVGNNIVGTGIVPRIKSAEKQNKSLDKKAAELALLWKKWADTGECSVDEQLEFYGIENLVARTVAESGECIVRRIRNARKETVPFEVEVLEPDYLDDTKTFERLSNGGFIIQGVEFDARRKRVAYWLFDNHPGESSNVSYTSRRVPAEDIKHVFKPIRAGQVRGIPWLAPVMVKLKDFDEYEDAQLVRQKVAACFSGFVEDAFPDNSTDLNGTSDTAFDGRLEPGIIETLPAGKRITFPNTPQVTGYKEFSSVTLHAIASAGGVTYESLTSDFSGVNFSSGRMGMIDMNRNIDVWQWHFFIPQFCRGVFKWFKEGAELKGYDTSRLTEEWTTPRRPIIDPSTEVTANSKAMRTGQVSWAELVRSLGYDPDDVLAEVKEYNDKMDKLGIVMDSDPRKTMEGGSLQASVKDPQSK